MTFEELARLDDQVVTSLHVGMAAPGDRRLTKEILDEYCLLVAQARFSLSHGIPMSHSEDASIRDLVARIDGGRAAAGRPGQDLEAVEPT